MATYGFTIHLRVHDHTTWFWRCLGMVFGHFLLGSHNFMITSLGSCVKWPLGPLTLQWRSPVVMNSRGIMKFDWPRVTLLSGGSLHYGQESFGGELGTKTWHGCQCGNTFWRGVLRRSSFLGNLKASDKNHGLQRTPTWIKKNSLGKSMYYCSPSLLRHFWERILVMKEVLKHCYVYIYIFLINTTLYNFDTIVIQGVRFLI